MDWLHSRSLINVMAAAMLAGGFSLRLESEGEMKRPGDTTPAPPGGRVAARHRQYAEQRGEEPGSPMKKTASARAAKKTTKKKRIKKTKKR
jgi:hypothetical protein